MRLLELKATDIDLITEVNGVRDYGLFIELVESSMSKKRLVEELDSGSVEQLESLEKFSSDPVIGQSYRATMLMFTGGKHVRLIGKKHFRKLIKFNNNQFTFEDGDVFPNRKISDLSYSKAFLFDSEQTFKKFMMMLTLSFKVDTDLSESYLSEAVDPKLGRAFNHLEDLVFFYGSEGTIEALEHLKDMNTEQGSSSVRMKWDGNPQIYWGRENGVFVPPHGHAQWGKGVLPQSGEDVAKYIMSTGRAVTPEEVASRQQFADKFASLAPLFGPGTPKELDGNSTFYVYADALFLSPPELKDGVYTFCPNPKSQTCYHVRADSELGRKIAQAEVMVVGHAYFTEHGAPDSAQVPIKDFTMFNANPRLIVLGPIYNVAPVRVDTTMISQVENHIKQHAAQVDTFLQGVAGLSDLKQIIYNYVNQTAKAKQLDNVSTQHFFQWMKTKVSEPKQVKIKELNTAQGNVLDEIFKIVKAIQILKDNVIDQIESGPRADIWDTHGEGRVRYADQNKQFGNVKFVPRKRWTPQ